MKKKWKWPYLRVTIEIPGLRIHTAVMYQSLERVCREYIVVYVQVFKWRFEFELYERDRWGKTT